MVTNPVDVLTYAALKFSGLPKGRVLGSGTVLDSARLRQVIARKLGVASQSVHAFIAGEHGDSEFPLWSTASIGTVPVLEFVSPGGARLDEDQEAQIAHDVVNAAYAIIQGKGATNYAVGLAGARVIEAILRDENGVLPVSSLLDGFHGISDVCLSLPSLVNKDGIGGMLDVPLSAREVELLKAAAAEVKSVASSLGL
jgi:L-lactate dehydrogenase